MAQTFCVELFMDGLLICAADTNEPLGYYVPPEDREWIHIEYQPTQIINQADFPELASIEFFGMMPLGLDTRWQELGFATREALVWVKQGKMSNPDIVKSWVNNGFTTPDQVQPWFRYLPTKSAAELAAALRDAGVDAASVPDWFHRGGVTAADVPPWALAGFDPRSVKPWKNGKFTPAEAKAWQEQGFSARDALVWKTLDLSVADRERWVNQGFNANSARDWLRIGINDPEEAWAWLNSNLEETDIHLWRNAGYTANEALEFRERDIYQPPSREDK